MTDNKTLNSKRDDYIWCPNCRSMNLFRDLRDKVNSCHECGFTHFVGKETTRQALMRGQYNGEMIARSDYLSGDNDMPSDVRHDVFNALGEAVHTLPDAKRLLAPVIQKHGQQAVDAILDQFYMVVNANMTGERFISMKIEHSADKDES